MPKEPEALIPGFDPFSPTRFPATKAQVEIAIKQTLRAWLDAWYEKDWETLRRLTDIFDDYPDPGGTIAGDRMSDSEWATRLGIHKKLELNRFKLNPRTSEGVTFPYAGALNVGAVSVFLEVKSDEFHQKLCQKPALEVTLYLKCQCREKSESPSPVLSSKPWSDEWVISLNAIYRILAATLGAANENPDSRT